MHASTMRRYRFRAVAAICVLALQGAAASGQRPDASDHGAALQAFHQNVDRYVRMRARLEEPLPSFDGRRDPWSLLLTRGYLASAIRTARSGAELGDIFTPPVADMFRDAIREAVYNSDIEGLVNDEFDIDDFAIDLRVLEPLPRWSLDAVPILLSNQLPELPAGIEYRLVGTALVLWDSHAEILIDALPDALSDE